MFFFIENFCLNYFEIYSDKDFEEEKNDYGLCQKTKYETIFADV